MILIHGNRSKSSDEIRSKMQIKCTEIFCTIASPLPEPAPLEAVVAGRASTLSNFSNIARRCFTSSISLLAAGSIALWLPRRMLNSISKSCFVCSNPCLTCSRSCGVNFAISESVTIRLLLLLAAEVVCDIVCDGAARAGNASPVARDGRLAALPPIYRCGRGL
jgi:hypothetical protein